MLLLVRPCTVCLRCLFFSRNFPFRFGVFGGVRVLGELPLEEREGGWSLMVAILGQERVRLKALVSCSRPTSLVTFWCSRSFFACCLLCV
jgi:hypothetical protein